MKRQLREKPPQLGEDERGRARAVILSNGTIGTVTVVSANQLTVAVANLLAGSLTASVKLSSVSSGTAVQVAPVVTPGSATLTAKGTIA